MAQSSILNQLFFQIKKLKIVQSARALVKSKLTGLYFDRNSEQTSTLGLTVEGILAQNLKIHKIKSILQKFNSKYVDFRFVASLRFEMIRNTSLISL